MTMRLIESGVYGFCGASTLRSEPINPQTPYHVPWNPKTFTLQHLTITNEDSLGLIIKGRTQVSPKISCGMVSVGQERFVLPTRLLSKEQVPPPLSTSNHSPTRNTPNHLHTIRAQPFAVVEEDKKTESYSMSTEGKDSLKNLCKGKDFSYMCGTSTLRDGMDEEEQPVGYNTGNYLSLLYSILEGKRANNKGWHWCKELGLYLSPLYPTFVNPMYMVSGGQSHSILLSSKSYINLPQISRGAIEI